MSKKTGATHIIKYEVQKPPKIKKTKKIHVVIMVVLSVFLSVIYDGSEISADLYLKLMVLLLLLGAIHVCLLEDKSMYDWNQDSAWSEIWQKFLFTFFLTFCGGFIFWIGIKNISSPHQWLLGALKDEKKILFCSVYLGYICPYFMYRAYEMSSLIPKKIYKKWDYVPFKSRAIQQTTLITFKVQESMTSGNSTVYKKLVPKNLSLGEQFAFFIKTTNKDNRIQDVESDEQGEKLGWMFYSTHFEGLKKKYYDPTLNLSQNKISSETIINAKRVY